MKFDLFIFKQFSAQRNRKRSWAERHRRNKGRRRSVVKLSHSTPHHPSHHHTFTPSHLPSHIYHHTFTPSHPHTITTMCTEWTWAACDGGGWGKRALFSEGYSEGGGEGSWREEEEEEEKKRRGAGGGCQHRYQTSLPVDHWHDNPSPSQPTLADNFSVDVHDPRFSALYDSHLYAPDPSDPLYKLVHLISLKSIAIVYSTALPCFVSSASPPPTPTQVDQGYGSHYGWTSEEKER